MVKAINGASRDSKWPDMRGGALQQITYPTGGYTSLVFQPNDTYVNFTKYTNTIRSAMSAGYDGHNGYLGDGGDNPISVNVSGTGNTFMFTLSNSTQGGTALLELDGSSILAAALGQSDTIYEVLSTGSHVIELVKNSAISGYGATASISENVPYTYAGNDTVGGLRIGTITNNDGPTPVTNTTSYSYTTGTQSSGILYSRPVYVQTMRNDVYGLVSGNATGCPAGCISPCNGGVYFHFSIQRYTNVDGARQSHWL